MLARRRTKNREAARRVRERKTAALKVAHIQVMPGPARAGLLLLVAWCASVCCCRQHSPANNA